MAARDPEHQRAVALDQLLEGRLVPGTEANEEVGVDHPRKITTPGDVEVALAIALAAVVGGVAFMLLDNWQRKHASPGRDRTGRGAQAPVHWTPYRASLLPPPPPRSTWAPPTAERRRLDAAASEERTEPLPPRPLWTPPSSDAPRSRWDDDDRYRGHDDEDDRRPASGPAGRVDKGVRPLRFARRPRSRRRGGGRCRSSRRPRSGARSFALSAA